mmetsp:Transcript_26215/g.55143  ORF Transcript_26215/g.55143 Transcript_26215/m.55143 type:complete len:98 (+) Transcript_26215:451-744(+)
MRTYCESANHLVGGEQNQTQCNATTHTSTVVPEPYFVVGCYPSVPYGLHGTYGTGSLLNYFVFVAQYVVCSRVLSVSNCKVDDKVEISATISNGTSW